MKTYMPLDGFRWSCDSDSALCDMRQTNVLGRAGAILSQKNSRLPYKRQKAIRSNKKNVIYDLMTDLCLTSF